MSNDHLGLDHVPLGASAVAVATQRLAQMVRADLGEVLAVRGDLSLLEWRICVALAERGPVPQKEIVSFCRMQQAQVSRALAVLQSRRLIHVEQGSKDRRSKLFHLTPEGRALFEKNLPDVERFCATIDDALTPQERSQFIDMCERIASACHDKKPAGTLPPTARIKQVT
ncbi:MarR family winged helix-turn-helix transcriptional regulator [Aquicoccus sp. G2-2]|jgi:DNA-binding MarR family transcriptional regulator|uniref:MarR family winged helix-turn-helix transcriptional regulator n=1 Tax=Aquicoccus sp. G2-2 TaxID=3092120 RepID=UPI002AE08A06|nr:MarR family transcriptional regulator [Aquicoccus sp. G2-2]MEA1114816.1 MarR family transcriptional regulator [Aquicoccus sp. G2-2]